MEEGPLWTHTTLGQARALLRVILKLMVGTRLSRARGQTCLVAKTLRAEEG